MYLKHFVLKKHPFTLVPSTEFYCNLTDYQAALNVLLYSLYSGEGIVKIIGEVGSGKTLLCRKLLNSLVDLPFVAAYIPNPDLTPFELKRTIARELRAPLTEEIAETDLTQAILKRLLELHRSGKRVVLIIDEAQALSSESLETLRLLTNLETESKKLLQIVLFGQPELNQRLQLHSFRQLNQRIAFSHNLSPLLPSDLDKYLQHRLLVAGYTGKQLFTRGAKNLLYRKSSGIPRVINILCNKAMLAAYGKGSTIISKRAMHKAVKDSADIVTLSAKKNTKFWLFSLLLSIIIVLVSGLLFALKVIKL